MRLSPSSILEYFHHPPKKKHYSHWQSLSIFPQPGNHERTSVCMHLPVLDTSYKWNSVMLIYGVSVWPLSLSIMPSGLIHAVAHRCFLPFHSRMLFHCMCVLRLVYPSLVEHLGCFHVWDVKSTAAANMSAHVFVWTFSLSRGFTRRSRRAGS